MRKLILLLLFIHGVAYAQPPKDKTKSSVIRGVHGNNNIITVIQGDGIVVKYDMLNDQQAQSFLNYIKKMPGLSKDIKQVLENGTKTLELVTKIYERTNSEGLFNQEEFQNKLEKYIRDNERLRMENEQLKKQTTDVDFVKALGEANKKLENFDNEGYDEVLENYKKAKKKEVANASYLQAKNNYNFFNSAKALSQINEALDVEINNVNYLYLKAQILYDKADYDYGLTIFLKIEKSNINDTLNCNLYNYIGSIYKQKCDYNRALEYYRKSLITIENKIDKSDQSIGADTHNNIGSVYKEMGEYSQALDYFKKALGNTIFFLNTPTTANIYNNIGGIYIDKGDYVQALEYFEQALIITENVFGSNNPNTADSYNNIGVAYESKGDYSKALIYYEKALRIFKAVFQNSLPFAN